MFVTCIFSHEAPSSMDFVYMYICRKLKLINQNFLALIFLACKGHLLYFACVLQVLSPRHSREKELNPQSCITLNPVIPSLKIPAKKKSPPPGQLEEIVDLPRLGWRKEGSFSRLRDGDFREVYLIKRPDCICTYSAVFRAQIMLLLYTYHLTVNILSRQGDYHVWNSSYVEQRFYYAC